MISRRSSIYAALALALLVAVYLLFGSSDERRALKVVREVARAIESRPDETPRTRDRRVSSALRSHTSDALVVTSPDFGDLRGQDAVLAALASLSGVHLGISFEDSTVQIASDDVARVQLVLSLLFRVPGEERRERRHVRVRLEQDEEKFRIVQVEVGPPSNEEPEARP